MRDDAWQHLQYPHHESNQSHSVLDYSSQGTFTASHAARVSEEAGKAGNMGRILNTTLGNDYLPYYGSHPLDADWHMLTTDFSGRGKLGYCVTFRSRELHGRTVKQA